MGHASKQAPQAVHRAASSGPAWAMKASVVSARAGCSLVIREGCAASIVWSSMVRQYERRPWDDWPLATHHWIPGVIEACLNRLMVRDAHWMPAGQSTPIMTSEAFTT